MKYPVFPERSNFPFNWKNQIYSNVLQFYLWNWIFSIILDWRPQPDIFKYCENDWLILWQSVNSWIFFTPWICRHNLLVSMLCSITKSGRAIEIFVVYLNNLRINQIFTFSTWQYRVIENNWNQKLSVINWLFPIGFKRDPFTWRNMGHIYEKDLTIFIRDTGNITTAHVPKQTQIGFIPQFFFARLST